MPELGGWDESDDALWHTCVLLADAERPGAAAPAPAVVATFRPHLGPGERLLAAAPFTRYEHRAAGEQGRRGGLFFATGTVGLTLTAAVAAGQAVSAVRRRRAARHSAVERWVPVDHGALTVSTHGFYLETGSGLFEWPWAAVTSASVVRPGHVVVAGRTAHGPVRWVLACRWAELVFALWARHQHPDHPQLVTGGWLPDGWLAWAAGQRGGTPPPALPGARPG